MAKCDEGYICQVCSEEVKGITQSDLYLRYVIGRVDPETLHLQPERHIKCNPSLAQYIDSPEFESVVVEKGFEKETMDPDYVQQETQLVTRGYKRLRELAKQKLPITDYPLQEFQELE